MPSVFVHGVPDTTRLWQPLLAELDELLARPDAVTLALPGFAAPVPRGWSATKEAYAAWLEEQLVELGEPVDLVAHDWGAILAQRVAATRPDLIRTLAVGSGPLDAEYEWHAMAQLWQTPDAGEQIMAGMLAMATTDLASGFESGGAPAELAAIQASNVDARMAECVLALYRSAVTVGAEWQPSVEAMAPVRAMVFHGGDDAYVDAATATRIARRLSAELVEFAGCGHWWPWERAHDTAIALTRLWA